MCGPATCSPAKLILTLQPVEVEEDLEAEHGDDRQVMFRPQIEVNGIGIDLNQCDIVYGYASPVEPVVVIADQEHDRLVVCTLRNARGTQLIQHLLDSDLTDLLIDAESAAKFSVGSSSVDPLIRVELPPQLAGPIEPVSAELVFELRPRPGAGLSVALRMHEDRFRELMIPGQPPDIVSCLSENGPVRLAA